MPFFDNLANVSNYYHGLKDNVSHFFNVGKKVVHGIRSGGDWINEKLDQLSSIPYLGEATKETIKKAKDYKVFGVASFNDIMGYTKFIDDTLQHSDIAERIGQTADYYISPVVEGISGFGRAMGGVSTPDSNPYASGVVSVG